MTKDDIIRMARETDCLDDQHYGSMWADKIERFANLVAAAEREACAALCFQIWNKWMDEKDTTHFPDAEDCANAIRARGQHDI
jgi:hypothetical protein